MGADVRNPPVRACLLRLNNSDNKSKEVFTTQPDCYYLCLNEEESGLGLW